MDRSSTESLVEYGCPLTEASVAVIAVHCRDQDPDYMIEHPVVPVEQRLPADEPRLQANPTDAERIAMEALAVAVGRDGARVGSPQGCGRCPRLGNREGRNGRAIVERIEQLLHHIDLADLSISPDCGMKYLS